MTAVTPEAIDDTHVVTLNRPEVRNAVDGDTAKARMPGGTCPWATRWPSPRA
jgi:hypothetical protein